MRLMMQIFLKARKIVHKFTMTMDNVCNNSNNKWKKSVRYAGGGGKREAADEDCLSDTCCKQIYTKPWKF